jgi:hypothetical protein
LPAVSGQHGRIKIQGVIVKLKLTEKPIKGLKHPLVGGLIKPFKVPLKKKNL